MARFNYRKVVTFRLGSESEIAALDRIAASQGKTRSEILRSFIRRTLIADLDQKGRNGKQHA